MKHKETLQNGENIVHRLGENFSMARDSRNRRVRSIQIRNGRYYALLWSDLGSGKKGTRRFPLFDELGNPCCNLKDAQESLELLKYTKRTGELPSIGRKPSLAAAIDEYLASDSYKSKAPATQYKEKNSLQLWKAVLGDSAKLESIATHHLSGYKALRRKGGMIGGKKREPAHQRTIQLEFLMLRNLLKYCKSERQWLAKITDFPVWRRLEIPLPPRRPLLSPDAFQILLESCHGLKNGVQLEAIL